MKTPQIIERNKLLLAGLTYTGETLGKIDVCNLWDEYEKLEPEIFNRICGNWYELHIGTELGGGTYSVTVGVEISAVESLLISTCIKIVPGGKFVHFQHRMSDGGFSAAFSNVDKWIKESGTKAKDFGLQIWGADFDPKKPESILHIYIPLVRD